MWGQSIVSHDKKRIAATWLRRIGQVEMVQFLLEQGADKNPDVPEWAKPLRNVQDYLEGHATLYSDRAHDQVRLNGHRTNA